MNESNCYLFAYFVDNGEDGLHLAWSRDGYLWEALNGGRSYLEPTVGQSKLMRDPCPLLGPDGTFHLVWTTSWDEKCIGYASSRDLLHWSEQRAIPVMAHEPETLNCWAPEIEYDEAKGQFLLFWATTIQGRFPETEGQTESNYNHRIYATTTRDWVNFTPAHLFFDPGFNVIDATMLHADGRFYLIFKDETLRPVRKHLHLATSDRIEGPFTEISPPFGPSWIEGPSALHIGDEYLVYFDAYRPHYYGAMRSHDLQTWEDISGQVSFPPGARHGAALPVPDEIILRLGAPTNG